MWGLMNAGDIPAGSEAGDGIQWLQEKLPQTGKNTIIATIMIMVININVIASVEEPSDLPPWLLPRHPKHQLRFHRTQQFNFCLFSFTCPPFAIHWCTAIFEGAQKLALGHRHPISCVSLSPSGQFLATGEEVKESLMKRICVLQHDFKAELGVRAAVIVWETQGWTQVQYSWSSMLDFSIIETQGWTQILCSLNMITITQVKPSQILQLTT